MQNRNYAEVISCGIEHPLSPLRGKDPFSVKKGKTVANGCDTGTDSDLAGAHVSYAVYLASLSLSSADPHRPRLLGPYAELFSHLSHAESNAKCEIDHSRSPKAAHCSSVTSPSHLSTGTKLSQ